MANLLITYALWLPFGLLGWHHVYLGRWEQAVAYICTFGGGFGVCWIRDLWRIPDYVAWANRDKYFERKHLYRMTMEKNAACGLIRSMGMLCLGFTLSLILCATLPDIKEGRKDVYTMRFFYILFSVLGSSTGVYLVSNIGELQCAFVYPLLGSAMGIPWLIGSEANIIMPTVIASVAAWWKGLRWRPISHRQRRHCVLFYSIAVLIWIVVLTYSFYFNAQITLKDGGKVPVRIVIGEFFKTSAWHNTKTSFFTFYSSQESWSQAYSDSWNVLDLSGELNAFKILGLDQSSSIDVIKKACREKSRQFHPDKVEGFQELFYEVQRACELLTKLRRATTSRSS